MKAFRTLFLVALALLFFNCSDDKDKNIDLNSLKESTWVGELLIDGSPTELIAPADLKIIFETESTLDYQVKYRGTDPLVSGKLKYTIADKKLRIESGESPLSGDWLLVGGNSKKMELVHVSDATTELHGRITLYLVH